MLFRYIARPRNVAIVIIGFTGVNVVVFTILALVFTLYSIHSIIASNVDRLDIAITSMALAPTTALVSIDKVKEVIFAENLSSCVQEFRAEFITLAYIPEANLTVVVKNISQVSLDGRTTAETKRSMKDYTEPYPVIVSGRLIQKLGVDTKSVLTLYSIWTGYPQVVYVKRVDHMLDGYTVLAPYDVVAAFRGVHPGYASIIVVKAYNETCWSKLVRSLTQKFHGEATLIVAALRLLERVDIEPREALIASSLSEAYALRLGLHRDIITAASAAIALLTSYAYYTIAAVLPSLERISILILRDQGASLRKLAVYYGSTVTLAHIVSTAGAYIAHLPIIESLTLIGYTLTPCNDILSTASVVTLLGAIAWVGLLKELKKMYIG